MHLYACTAALGGEVAGLQTCRWANGDLGWVWKGSHKKERVQSHLQGNVHFQLIKYFQIFYLLRHYFGINNLYWSFIQYFIRYWTPPLHFTHTQTFCMCTHIQNSNAKFLVDSTWTTAGSRDKNRPGPDIKLSLPHSLLWEHEHYVPKKVWPSLIHSGFKTNKQTKKQQPPYTIKYCILCSLLLLSISENSVEPWGPIVLLHTEKRASN